mmetsp:Transcript_14636/g.33112  ORF Transcript_14636/g.33112 Transcript_14636/m.33112 type:complete len:85 (+) Transcript_14636:157-411(+)
MASETSSRTDSNNGTTSFEVDTMLEGSRGRKSIENAKAKDTLLDDTTNVVVSDEDSVDSTESVGTDTDDDWESDEESDDEEDGE